MKSDNRTEYRPSVIKDLVRIAMKANRAIFIWGSPGIGKSELVAQLAAEQGRVMIDIRLLLMEPTDLKGMPYFDSLMRSLRWAKPCELPEKISAEYSALRIEEQQKIFDTATLALDSGIAGSVEEAKRARDLLDYYIRVALEQNAILFLDELNTALPSVQAAAYQLVLNRRVGEYVLPEGVSIIAAGNHDSDRGATWSIPTPLCNRFTHVNMCAHFNDWQAWAIDKGINPLVVGFLSQHKSRLFSFDPKSNEKAFATSRTWVILSELIDAQPNMSEQLLHALTAGTVGEGVAMEFMGHIRTAGKMPSPDTVLSGGKYEWGIKEMSAGYSMILSLCYALREWQKMAIDGEVPSALEGKVKKYDIAKWHENFDNFLGFCLKHLSGEMVILGARTAFRDFKMQMIDHRKLSNFEIFRDEYGQFFDADSDFDIEEKTKAKTKTTA